ncbi:MBL fold metallo-hydrolase [Candidatus Lokiarchaeum ossiferum]|uniref:MBL fold metallo-hydrolase n=1 Tax=Candidatus Lokiarchaeum ossiferum TaxID=2951803 RepID=UPI00352C910C
MGSVRQFGPISIIRMGKRLFGRLIYPVHCFVLEDTLIDTGSKSGRKEFLEALKKFQINTAIITHSHEDHIGNNQILQKRYNINTLAHKKAMEIIENPKLLKLLPYQKIAWKLPEPSTATEIGDHVSIGKYKLEVIYTPGHSIDHICLFEPTNGWLFTGDLFLGRKIMYLRKLESFYETLHSLRKLVALDVKTVFCGFKGIVKDGKEAIQGKITYMEQLRENVLSLAEKKYSAKQICRKTLGREDFMCYMTGHDFQKQHLIDQILENPARG